LGRIVSSTGLLAQSFGRDVICQSRSEKGGKKKGRSPGYEYSDMEEHCKNSDIFSLHCSLNPETERILNSERLEMLKEGAIFLNVKAWFDALEDEEQSKEILETENALLTSHSGCATEEAQKRLKNRTIENIQEFNKA
jgi:glycerate dehydrogenase